MNSVYNNPEYLEEIDSYMNDFQILLYKEPMEAYSMVREMVFKITNKEQYKKAVSCGSITNCSFCCHDKIIMGKTEADFIKKVIKQKGIIPNKHRIEQQNNNPKIKWMDKACPMLLDENEKGERLCSIYDDRPIICITHNSSEEASNCNKEKNPNGTIREAKVAALDALSFIGLMLGNGTQIQDPSKTMVPLHEMLAKMEF